MAQIKAGDTVAVFGCGPVGQFTIASAFLAGAGRVLAADCVPSRLAMAQAQGAEAIDFNAENPVETIHALTASIGVDRAIDAVGVDAEAASHGPAYVQSKKHRKDFDHEVTQVAPKTNTQGDLWVPGNAPSQVLHWAVESLAKAGTLAIIGVYPPAMQSFPIGLAMSKNLTIQMGNCNHRKYIPELVRMVLAGEVDPLQVLTHRRPLTLVIEAYEAFDKREPGWVKVELRPAA